MSDTPILALLRQEWISWHLRRYAVRISDIWPVPGESKTTRSIRKNGFLGGLAVSHAALLTDFAGAARATADLVLPSVPPDDGFGHDIENEWIAVGVSRDNARALRKGLVDDFNYAARALDDARTRLVGDSSAYGNTYLINASSSSRQYTLAFVPSLKAIETLLLPVRQLDMLDSDDLRYRNASRPLYDVVLDDDDLTDVAEAAISQPLVLSFAATLLINEEHLLRLRAMYLAATVSPESTPCAFETRAADPRRDVEWLQRLFCLVARYETAYSSARGLQGALPERVFAALVTHLGVEGECYASPLNCHFPRAYFSAFPDVDSSFSSLGNFYSSPFPAEGVWEANPPYTNAALSAAVARICGLLAAAQESQRALLFFLVTPAWPLAPFAQSLDSSPWVRASGLLIGGEHSFVDGMQHREDSCRRLWRTLADSHFYVLATDAAHRRLGQPAIARALIAVLKAFEPESDPEDRERAAW